MRKLFFICCLFVSLNNQAQEVLKISTFSALMEQLQKEPRPVIVFFHTSWCGYCALMEKKTFQDPEIIKVLNENFYFIPFNAESEETIAFKGQQYQYKKKGLKSGVHEVVSILAKENTYPALVFLTEDLQIVYQHYAYVRSKDMQKLLNVMMQKR